MPGFTRDNSRYQPCFKSGIWRISSLSDVGECVEFPQAADSKMLLLISDTNVEENHS